MTTQSESNLDKQISEVICLQCLTIIIFRKKNKTPAASLEKLNHWPIISINPLIMIRLQQTHTVRTAVFSAISIISRKLFWRSSADSASPVKI